MPRLSPPRNRRSRSSQEAGEEAHGGQETFSCRGETGQATGVCQTFVGPYSHNSSCYAGVFAPNASLRGVVARPPSPPPPPPSLPGPRPPLADGPRRPRLDWAAVQQRTFGDDAYLCPCGGRRAVLAVVTNPRTAEELLRNLGLLAPRPQGLPPSEAPPQLSLGL